MRELVSQNFIDDLLDRADIVGIIGSRIQLKKTGRNYLASCPFHQEKTPSFSVNPTKRMYYCFGCGSGGNTLNFIMQYDNISFIEAIKDLATQQGVQVPNKDNPALCNPDYPNNSLIYAALNSAHNLYLLALRINPQRKIAIDYLKNRGITGETARNFGLGFAPPEWNHLKNLTKFSNVNKDILIKSGLLIEDKEKNRCYDRFRNRVIFPIRNSRGKVIAFGGRILENTKPKYLNSPESEIFCKSKELYGLFEIHQSGYKIDELIVVEGYTDVIMLSQHGMWNTVATLGTSVTEEHIKLLFRVSPNILFCFDGDQAGEKASWRALQATLPYLKDTRKVRFLFLSQDEDPDSLVQSQGIESFKNKIKFSSETLIKYLFREMENRINPSSIEGKAHIAAVMPELIKIVPGRNLRRLMYQHLETITGLDVAPDYEYFGNRLPQQRKQPNQELQLLDVENPILIAIRSLLHDTQLVKKIKDPNFYISVDGEPHSALLLNLVKTIKNSPEIPLSQLLSTWKYDVKDIKLIQNLLEREWLITVENIEKQFIDTMNTLLIGLRERNIQKILLRSQKEDLSPEDKEELRGLLNSN